MNPLHLLWIIPLSASAGAFFMALLAVNKDDQFKECHTRCKDCVWYAPVESMPEAEKIHNKLHELFDGILPAREVEVGVCRKVTFCNDKPVLTNEDGYCHRAERKN